MPSCDSTAGSPSWRRSPAPEGTATFRAYAQYADEATFVGTDVGYGDLYDFGGKDAVSSVVLARPTEPGTLTAPTPTISGVAQARRTLTALPGTWEPSPVDLSYQWYADGEVIEGATEQVLALTPDLRRKVITVEVTGVKPGFTR